MQKDELVGMHSLSEKMRKCHCSRAVNGEGPTVYLLRLCKKRMRDVQYQKKQGKGRYESLFFFLLHN